MPKKSFKGNPALQFFSQGQTDEQADTTPAAAAPAEPAAMPEPQAKDAGAEIAADNWRPGKAEMKSRRVQLLLKPSSYEKAKAAAAKYGISVNEYISQIIDREH